MKTSFALISVIVAVTRVAWSADASAPKSVDAAFDQFLAGHFKWTASAPLIGPVPDVDQGTAIKDPSVVFFDNRWHIYATLRHENTANMEYLAFADWKSANSAPRTVISLVDGYHCAPEILYFTPQKKWYLIYQAAMQKGSRKFGPVYSTLEDVSKPSSLTPPVALFPMKPEKVPHWIDFWVICDETHAYLFFTGDDGCFWRSRTTLADFPGKWSEPELVLRDEMNDFYEATHTYHLKGLNKYMTLVEAKRPGEIRYYKVYLADRLDGKWTPLARTWDKPFACIENVTFAPGVAPWTDSISHGELLREGYDEKLEADPKHLRFLFQGCMSKEREGKKYSQYPWRLGILEPVMNP